MTDARDEIDPGIFDELLDELLDEYCQPHRKPWVVGFSGGKDSTLTAQLAVEAVLRLPPSQRRREVHIVCNDTLVESPVVAGFVERTLARMRDAAGALLVPMRVVKTTPDRGQTFWMNLIGRGYPPPTRRFRWCTDRLKIAPTGEYIRGVTEAGGGSVLLLGVRSAESSARARSVARHGRERLNPHGSVRGCSVYRPIVDLTTDEVWAYLLQNRPPWGGSHRDLATLYRNALGGECPFVVDASDAPSCGESGSSRFGCWTCTVVQKDRSLANMVDNGFEHLEPLLGFRDWLLSIAEDPAHRLGERRDGTRGRGPFSFEARAEILRRLLAVQAEVGSELISPDDVANVRRQWDDDRSAAVVRRLAVFQEILDAEDP